MDDINQSSLIDQNKSIEFLKTCDLRTVSEESLFENLKILLTGQRINTLLYNPGEFLYRGIAFSNKPEYYADLIYPPIDKARQNRASGKNEQMFYCSNLKKAPFYELFVNIGDRLVLTTWCLNKSVTLNNIGYTKTNLQSFSSQRAFSTVDVDDNFVANEIGALFCKKVTSEESHYYNLTNAIAKKYLFADVITKNYNVTPIFELSPNSELHKNEYNSSQQFPGIVYPTIHNDGIADNFAIKKQAIDDGIIKFEKAEYIEIVDVKDNMYKYKIIDIASEIIDSKIDWKNLKREWYLYDDTDDINFVFENGSYNAYTAFGDLLEPIK